jgi:hypothetical protein
VDGLYDWRMPNRPEDLSVLSDGTPLLTTIAHEVDGYLDLTAAQAEELTELDPGLRLFRGNIVPRSAEPYRLFGAFLDEGSVTAAGSLEAALVEYISMTSADKVEAALVAVRDVLLSHGDEALLMAVLQRWGAGRSLTIAPRATLSDIAQVLATKNRNSI